MKPKGHLLQIWLLCAVLLPAAVQAQFFYTTNNGTITITGDYGSSQVVNIPAAINGLPVTDIAAYAFYHHTYPTKVTIPNSVTSIGAYAFADGYSLTNITIGSSVCTIGDYAFQDCFNVSSITIPNTTTNIGYEAFFGCSSLTGITVNPANSFYSSTNGVLFNKNKTILIKYPATVGGSYTILQSVTNIANDAFDHSANLTSVTIPNSVTLIGSGAFFACGNLTNIEIGSAVTTIGSSAFQGCLSLTSVTIPNSVFSFGRQAFGYCTNLVSVTMGTNVAWVSGDLFLASSSLKGIYFAGNAPGFISDFDYADNTATVYYLPWSTGFPTPGTPFAGCPTALWLPQAQANDASFGVQTNQFGFNITWANDTIVVVEACTDLANADWTPVGTNTLTGGSSYFSDSLWTNYPDRFYRLRSP